MPPPRRGPTDSEQLSDNSILRTLTAQLSGFKQRRRTETFQLMAALAAGQGEILALKRGVV